MDSITLENGEISITQFLNKNSQLSNAKSLSIYSGSINYKSTDSETERSHLLSVCAKIRSEFSEITHIAISYQILDSSVKIIAAVGGKDPNVADAVKCLIRNFNSTQIPNIKMETDLADAEIDVLGQGRIDPNIVQLTASNDEIKKRIKSYIDRKREQVNVHNIQDFIHKNPVSGEEEENCTCSRVSSVFVKRKDSKGHLHVHKVENSWGPQTYKKQKIEDSQSVERSHGSDLSIGIAERIVSAEKYVNIMAPVPKDVYERLRSIEDRISQLEATSPEYAQFWGTAAKEDKYMFSVDDIDQKMKMILDS